MIKPEELAVEICSIVNNFTVTSYEAAQKVYEHLENNYPDCTILYSYYVDNFTEIIKAYRSGDTLTNAVQKIIDLVGMDDSGINPTSGFHGTLGLGSFGILKNLPPFSTPTPPSQTYSYCPINVGLIDLTTTVNYLPDKIKWLECDGKMIDSLLYNDLYNFIQNDIMGFENYVNNIMQTVGSHTTYSSLSTFSANMQLLFNIPIIKDHSIKVLS